MAVLEFTKQCWSEPIMSASELLINSVMSGNQEAIELVRQLLGKITIVSLSDEQIIVLAKIVKK